MSQAFLTPMIQILSWEVDYSSEDALIFFSTVNMTKSVIVHPINKK